MGYDIPFEVIAKIAAPALAALIGAMVKHYLEARPRLITYLIHASAIPLPGAQPPAQVNTHSVVVANTGKKSAMNVRIGHNMLPPSFQVWPPVHFELSGAAGGKAEIVLPTLVPGEQVTISYLYFPPATFHAVNSYAKSDECMAKIIDVMPSPRPNKLVLALLWALLFIGTSTVLYWLLFRIAAWVA